MVGKDEATFHGACMDTGATKTVIGPSQAAAYARFTNNERALLPSELKAFRFGGATRRSIGLLEARIPIAADLCVCLAVEVVDLDEPLFSWAGLI